MCRRIDCSKCGRPTYAGCGAHVEQVLGNVLPAERCRCREDEVKSQQPVEASRSRSWLRTLLGR
jgi:hypothetical protein